MFKKIIHECEDCNNKIQVIIPYKQSFEYCPICGYEIFINENEQKIIECDENEIDWN